MHAAAYLNEADPELKNHVDALEWLHLGQVKRLIRFFKQNDIQQAVMLGAIRKTRMFTDVQTGHEGHWPDRRHAPYP